MRMTVVLIALLFLGMTLPARARDQAPAAADPLGPAWLLCHGGGLR